MKKNISLLIAAFLALSSVYGCAEQKKDYVSIDENSFITEYSETVEDTYSETKNDGLELYEKLFSLDNKVSVNIFMSKEEIGKLQEDYITYTENDESTKSDIYRKADVTFAIGNDSYTVEEVGIRLKGNMSLAPLYDYDGKPNICSFKLSFDETFDDKNDYGDDIKKWSSSEERDKRKKRTFATMEELDVKWNISYDQTNIREIYATKLFEATDSLVQKIGLSQLQFNGNNYGLVKIYEPVDKIFLEKRLPESALGGDLYKCMWSECDNSGNRTGRWRGVKYTKDNSYGIQNNPEGKKFNFNLKTNKRHQRMNRL